jgi:hypothetical protein
MLITPANGLPSASDLEKWFDAWASLFKAEWPVIGIGDPSETATGAALAAAARAKIMGDGGTNYGLQSAGIKTLSGQFIEQLARSENYASKFGFLRQPINLLDVMVKGLVPSVWNWNDLTNQKRSLDLWLQRLNATAAGAPAKPTGTPVLTATTGGSIPNVVSGSAPRFVYTFVKAGSDWLESQPSAVAVQIALAGANNAYSVTGIQNPIPAGVDTIRCYRGLIGGGAGIWFWDQDVACVAGSAPPAFKLTQGDSFLRQDISPPVWLQVLFGPEAAFLFMNAVASVGQRTAQLAIDARGMLSESNAALGPVNQFLGRGNQINDGTFATWVGGTGTTLGTIRTANDAGQIIQGFAGGVGLQARVTGVLDANGTVNVTYDYLDATGAHVGATTGAIAITAAVGSVADLGIAAGRLVTGVTAVAVVTSTTGTIVIEAKPVRSI